ncbi:MAG: NAD-binding protein [Moraxella osloensis]
MQPPGIGLQLAMDYLSQGHEVYTVGRNSDVLHTLAAMGAKTIQLDLTEYDAVMQAFSDIKTLDLFIAAAKVFANTLTCQTLIRGLS